MEIPVNHYMRIFVPFTEIQPATKIALSEYDYVPAQLADDNSYFHYFKKRWASKQTFINLEHDVVPWPGALEAIWNCPEPWCAYNYGLHCHRGQDLTTGPPPIGLVKISDTLIKGAPHCWDEPIDWEVIDLHLATEARKGGFEVHQHYPSVVNANKVLLTT